MKYNNIYFRGTILSLLLVVAWVATSCTFDFVRSDPPIKIILMSSHDEDKDGEYDRYVIAKDEDDSWSLRQEPELTDDDCGVFTLHSLVNGKVALKTCHDKYVTAPKTGDVREDWKLTQETQLTDCGQFDLYELGGGRVAFRTCDGNFLTAGDGGWKPELAWSIVAETGILNEWEKFMLVEYNLNGIR